MLLTCSQIKALEEHVFAQGAHAGVLMEEAGRAMAQTVRRFFPVPGRCVVHFGKGHNGGDALVAARTLAQAGWQLELAPAFAQEHWSPLTLQNFHALQSASFAEARALVETPGPLIVLDGLLGIGAGGALREPIRTAARAINGLRREKNAFVFALDLPSGLDGDSGQADPDAVRADFTLTVGFAKSGLVADGATPFVGRLAVLPLKALSACAQTFFGDACLSTVATADALAPLLPRRPFDMHKGECGRVVLLAGSRGTLGAALMSAEAAVRAGAGLVSLCVPAEIYPLVAAAAAPEVMVHPVEAFEEVLTLKHDVLAIGPGLGSSRQAEILELLRRAQKPMIVDADALNALSTRMETLGQCAAPRLLTPHPGEMARLDPESAGGESREQTVRRFMGRHGGHVLLLKGSRTLVGEAGKALSYNSTGSPGMASGGMGDVLTGVCAALVGQHLSLYDAARLGAWVCGRAAEVAIYRGQESEESFRATALLGSLGAAFKELRQGGS